MTKFGTKLMAVALVGLAAACQEPSKTGPISIGGETLQDHAVAGQTLRCELDGVAAQITFSRGGRLSGRFLRATIDGTWSPVTADAFSIVASVPSGTTKDTLKVNGSRWVGSAIVCD